MEMVCEFACEVVESVEVTVELILTVGRTDEATVAEPLEHPIDGVAVVVAPGSEVSDSSRLVEMIEHFEALPRQQLRKLDVWILSNEVLIQFDGSGIRGNDSLPTAVPFRVEQAFLGEVGHGTREIALAVVELRRELGDRIATLDSSEDLEFDPPEHRVTQYETVL
jgi:hypothetical protein